MRCGRHGLRRCVDHRFRCQGPHGGSASCSWRALARRVSVRASPPAVCLLRCEFAASRQRNHRPARTEPGFLRARQRARDLRVQRPRYAEAATALRARCVTSRCASISASAGSSLACRANNTRSRCARSLSTQLTLSRLCQPDTSPLSRS